MCFFVFTKPVSISLSLELELEMAEDIPLSPLPPLIPFLPDDISVRCIARVPVSSHTALSHVSRSWRSFVRSPSFFSLRSELAVTEFVLTVSIQKICGGRSRWYHLHPHRPPSRLPPTLEQEEEHVDSIGTSSVSVGPRLFLLGRISSPRSLQIYDARLRRWSHGPPLSKRHMYGALRVAGGRVHVLGFDNYLPHSPSAESLNLAGTRWEPLPPIPAHLFGLWLSRSAIMDGKLVVVSGGIGSQLYTAAFDPNTAEWSPAPLRWLEDRPIAPLAVVGGVPYVLDNHAERILGYDNDGQWRLVEVEGEFYTELFDLMYEMRLLSFGRLLCLVGKEMDRNDDLETISCTVIDVSRTDDGGFKGSIKWSDSSLLVLSVEESLRHCLVLEI